MVAVWCAAFTTARAAEPIDPAQRSAARALGKEAVVLFRKGEYAAALDRFSRAHAIVRLTTTGLWRGRCLVELGRLVEGSEQLLDVSRMSVADDARALFHKAKADAASEHLALQARIGHIKLIQPAQDTSTQELSIKLDGKPVPAALLGVNQPIDPGTHHLEARRGEDRFSKRFTIAEGASMELLIELQPKQTLPKPKQTLAPTTQSSNWQPALGWVGVALGGGAVIGGAITGGLALAKQDELQTSCPDFNCLPAQHDGVDTFGLLRTTSTAALVAGASLLTTGIILLVTSNQTSPPSDSNAAKARPRFVRSAKGFLLVW